MEKLHQQTDRILGGVQSLDRMHFDMHHTSWLQELGGAIEGIRCPEKVRMGNILLEALNSQVLNSSIGQSAPEKCFPAETLNVYPDRASNLALLQMLDEVGIDRVGVPCFNDGLHGQLPMLDQAEKQPSFQQLLAFPFSDGPEAYGLDHMATRDEFLPDYDMNISSRFGQGRPNNLLQSEVRLFEPESCITHVNSESCSLIKTEAKDQFSSLDAPEEGVSSANQERNSSNTANSSENCNDRKPDAPSQGIRERRKRKRSKACKNSEEVESQRMTHIAVERNRRKQMNEHLSVLRSLMPGSFIQRGDQASIIGGAIDFVKELEQLLQSLQAQKRRRQCEEGSYSPTTSAIPVFNGFFLSPQYTSYSSQWKARYIMDNTNNSYLDPPANELTAENKSAVADIEVTVIETHASLKILSQKRPGQLLKTIAALENLDMSILHLNITTIDHSVLYSFNVKIGEECQLSSADEIAATVHQIFSMIHTDNQVNRC